MAQPANCFEQSTPLQRPLRRPVSFLATGYAGLDFFNVVLTAGRSVVELSLFILLPIMVVMLCCMRLLETWGILGWIVSKLTPILRPFGLTGLGVFAMLQCSFVSFAAPLTTLSIMDRQGASERHIAATLAMVLAMGQANVIFPLASQGLDLSLFLPISLLGGLGAAWTTYYLLGRTLSSLPVANLSAANTSTGQRQSSLGVINAAGKEALQMAIGIIPLVSLALVAVTLLNNSGAFALLEQGLTPLLSQLAIDPAIVMPTLIKYLAGGTAVLGALLELHAQQSIDTDFINASAGWLIHSLDLPGIAILISAGPRVAKVWLPAVFGSFIGILIRCLLHIFLV